MEGLKKVTNTSPVYPNRNRLLTNTSPVYFHRCSLNGQFAEINYFLLSLGVNGNDDNS
jgi:hypothetical protein